MDNSMTGRFLVKETKDYFNADPDAMIIDVLVVLEILDSKCGKIIIGDYLCSGYPEDIEPYFLQELLDLGYKFSDDEKYEGWTNGKYHSAFLNGYSPEDEGLYE